MRRAALDRDAVITLPRHGPDKPGALTPGHRAGSVRERGMERTRHVRCDRDCTRPRRDDGQCRSRHAGGTARDRDRRRTRRIHRTAARRSRRRGGEDRAVGRQCDATHRSVSRGSAWAGTLAVLLELQPQQEVGGARSARDPGARTHAAPVGRRGRAAGCELRRTEPGTGTGSRQAGRSLSVVGDGAHDAFR